MGVFPGPGSRTSGGVHLFLVHGPEYVISEWLSRRTQIMMIELLRAGGIDQVSSRSDINDLAGYMWDPVAKRDMGFFVARVPTDGNPSDGPSRADFSELERKGVVLLLNPTFVSERVAEGPLPPCIKSGRTEQD